MDTLDDVGAPQIVLNSALTASVDTPQTMMPKEWSLRFLGMSPCAERIGY